MECEHGSDASSETEMLSHSQLEQDRTVGQGVVQEGFFPLDPDGFCNSCVDI